MRSAKTLEELRHNIGDVLDVASLSDAQMVQTLLKRINGSATLKQVLTAALSAARERRNERVIELELEVEELKQNLQDAESDCAELETTLRGAQDMHIKHHGG